MGKSKALIGTVGIALILAISTMAGPTANAAHTLPVGLGTAAPFAILAGTPNITNVPTSVINGNVGLSPATGAGIGLACAEVTGTIFSVDAAGPLPCRVTNPGLLTTAKTDLTTAYGDAAGRLGGLPVTANQLAGQTLPHGVYKSAAAMDLSVNGTLILDGGNDPNAVFIFQLGGVGGVGGLLTVGNGSTVSLINQAQSCNVFWQVDSATIGTTATFRGTILAATAITVAANSTVDGRLLARNDNVTLISDTITKPTCAAAATPTPTASPTAVPTATPTASPTAVPTATPSAAPTAGPTAAPPAERAEQPTPTPAPATPTPAPATPTPAPVTPAPASATPAPALPITTPAATTPGPIARAAPAAPIATLPFTSTLDRTGPLALVGLLLAVIGALILRSRRSAATAR